MVSDNANDSTAEANPRKRNRLSLACTMCKKRKVKCDRGRPCTSCVKYNVPSSCEYQEPTWSTVNMDGDSSGIFSAGTQLINNYSIPIPKPTKLSPQASKGYYATPEYSTFEQLTSSFRAKDPTSPKIPVSQPLYNFSASNTVSDSIPSSKQEPVIQSELEKLKDKIKQIEASIAVANLANSVYNDTTNLKQQEVQHPRIGSNQFSETSDRMNSQFSHQYTQGRSLTGISPIYNDARNHGTNSPHSKSSVQLPPIQMTTPHGESTYLITNMRRIDIQSNQANSCDQINDPFGVLGVNPVYASDCILNFFDGYTPVHVRKGRTSNHGPLCWVTIMKKDPALNLIWEKIADSRRRTKSHNHESADIDRREGYNENNPINEEIFRTRALGNEVGVNIHEFKGKSDKKRSKAHDAKPKKRDRSKEILPLGAQTYGNIEDELDFIGKVKSILPKQKVIWLLIDRFFRYVYPSIPFVDESEFRAEIATMIGERGFQDSDITSIEIQKKFGFAHMGSLLLMIRFGYLSLLSNNSSVNEKNLNPTDTSEEAQNIKYLLQNPVESEIVNCAQMCLNQFRLLRKSSLPILQCAIFMRFYRIFAPEEGDGIDGGDSQIFNGMLVQMANSIGLNRDPQNFKDIISDEKQANLWRKIWTQLVVFDMLQGIMLGNPLTIREKFYDTKLPYHLPSINDNVSNPNMEAKTIECFTEMGIINQKVRKILEVVLDIRGNVELYRLSSDLNDLEMYILDRYKSLDNLLTPYDKDDPNFEVITRISRVKVYIQLKIFLSSIYYYYFLFYEQKNKTDLAFFYLKKLLVVGAVDLMPYLTNLLTNLEDYFGPGYDLIVTPMIEMAFHKTVHLFCSSIVRTKLSFSSPLHRSTSDSNPEIFENKKKITSLSKLLVSMSQKGIRGISPISDRYYYAWRMTKAQNYILNLVKTDAFYHPLEPTSEGFKFNEEEVMQLNQRNCFVFFNGRQLDELIDVISFSGSKSEKKYSGKSTLRKGSTRYHLDGANDGKNMSNISGTPIHQPGHSPGKTPGSVASNSITQDFVNNEGIDSIWLQMMTNKNNNRFYNTQLDMNLSDTNHGQNASSSGFNLSNGTEPNLNSAAWNNIDSLSDYFKDEASPFDLFGDLPFDQIVNMNGLN